MDDYEVADEWAWLSGPDEDRGNDTSSDKEEVMLLDTGQGFKCDPPDCILISPGYGPLSGGDWTSPQIRKEMK